MADLIIFSGQSNMQGETERRHEKNDAVKGAMEYRFLTDELVELRHPVGEDIGNDAKHYPEPEKKTYKERIENAALFKSWKGNSNMVPFFCDEYVKITGREVVACHCAKGSTVLAYWQKGEIGYEMLLKKASAAKKKVNPEHIYFIWLQGESDAICSTSKEGYKKGMLKLNEDLKKDLGIEIFANILVGRFTGTEKDDEIINAQIEVCRENSDFIMATDIIKDIWLKEEYMNPEVAGHLSATGQEVVGIAAAKGLCEALKIRKAEN